MRFRKIWQGRGWWLGELCEVPRCLLWRHWGVSELYTIFLVSSSINVSIFHITWLDAFQTDLVHALIVMEYFFKIKDRSSCKSLIVEAVFSTALLNHNFFPKPCYFLDFQWPERMMPIDQFLAHRFWRAQGKHFQ